ncbi:hypothetical protein [Rothia sp. CCM 9419]|uniref:hypothetical protein n=1 Tax=Rothia sp. CCM 9419 TaxID=3402662 RepID=UPI003AE283A6
MSSEEFQEHTPYLFHQENLTIILGKSAQLATIKELIHSTQTPTTTTYWGQHASEELITSLATPLTSQNFWETITEGLLLQTHWPTHPEGTLYYPTTPPWLNNAPSWEYDPICPPDGPGALGGWIHLKGPTLPNHQLALFQLTDENSFWIFSSAKTLQHILQLCKDIAPIREHFEYATGYLGDDAQYQCIALPITCRHILEDELTLQGKHYDSFFWE